MLRNSGRNFFNDLRVLLSNVVFFGGVVVQVEKQDRVVLRKLIVGFIRPLCNEMRLPRPFSNRIDFFVLDKKRKRPELLYSILP